MVKVRFSASESQSILRPGRIVITFQGMNGDFYVDHQQISLVNNGWWIEIFSSLQNNPVFLYGWQQVECGRHCFKVRQVAQK